jgi:hypothetical protein
VFSSGFASGVDPGSKNCTGETRLASPRERREGRFSQIQPCSADRSRSAEPTTRFARTAAQALVFAPPRCLFEDRGAIQFLLSLVVLRKIVGLRVAGEDSLLQQVLTPQAVGVFVRSSLPAAVRITEVNFHRTLSVELQRSGIAKVLRLLPHPFPSSLKTSRAFVTTAARCLVTARDNTSRSGEGAARDYNYRGSTTSRLRARVWSVGRGTCSVCWVGKGR